MPAIGSTLVDAKGLRAARKARRLTVKAAAESFGFGRTQWTNWESSGQAPEAELQAIADAWGIPLRKLMKAPAVDPEAANLKALDEALGKLDEALKGVRAAVRDLRKPRLP